MDFMILVAIWLAGAASAGAVASAKGRNGGLYFALGLLFWPLALLVAIGMPSLKDAGGAARSLGANDLVNCPRCGKHKLAGATRCPHCGVHMTPATQTLRPCPYCAELIQPAAIRCRFCGADVPPTATWWLPSPGGDGALPQAGVSPRVDPIPPSAAPRSSPLDRLVASDFKVKKLD